MSRSYDVAALAPLDPTDETWALATARRFLRDTPNATGAFHPRSFMDVELVAQATLDSVAYEGTVYFRPHVAAANLLRANPERVLSFSAAGYSETHADAEALAKAILTAGQGIDDLINELAGVIIATNSRFARVVF